MAGVIQNAGHICDIQNFDDFNGELTAYTKLILASRIRYGKHCPRMAQWIVKHKDTLALKETAFVSVSLVARKPEKTTATTNPYVRKFLKQTHWNPNSIGIFAGCVDYSKYKWLDKFMIKLIMRITKWPVHATQPIEYTQWDAVTQFATDFAGTQNG
jgi:menaquinone-dependent protoporphyrinogen oxidase